LESKPAIDYTELSVLRDKVCLPRRLRPLELSNAYVPRQSGAADSSALPGYFLVLNTSRYGTADRPSVSLKLSNFSLFTHMA